MRQVYLFYYQLGHVELMKIHPSSQTIKLLNLRGTFACVLIRKYLAGNKRRGESFLTGSQTRTVAESLQNPEDMHRALQILEIIDCILQHARESSVKVAPLARVCKTFSGPALDSTWRVLHKPLPLLKLFSGLEMDTVREPYFYAVVYVCRSPLSFPVRSRVHSCNVSSHTSV